MVKLWVECRADLTYCNGETLGVNAGRKNKMAVYRKCLFSIFSKKNSKFHKLFTKFVTAKMSILFEKNLQCPLKSDKNFVLFSNFGATGIFFFFWIFFGKSTKLLCLFLPSRPYRVGRAAERRGGGGLHEGAGAAAAAAQRPAQQPEGAAQDGGAAHHPAPAGQFRRPHITHHQADAQVVT